MIECYLRVEGEVTAASLQDQAIHAGKYSNFFTALQEKKPEVFKLYEELGKGSLTMGYLNHETMISKMLFYFGEVYNILEENGYDFKNDDFLKDKMRKFAAIRSKAFSANSSVMTKETYNEMCDFIQHMIQIADEKGLLAKYNIYKEEYKIIRLR